MSKKSRRTTATLTRNQEIERIQLKISFSAADEIGRLKPSLFVNHISEQTERDIWAIEELKHPYYVHHNAIARAIKWMEENPEYAQRCWWYWGQDRIPAKEDVFSPMRKIINRAVEGVMPTSEEVIAAYRKALNEGVKGRIECGILLNRLKTHFPRRIIWDGNVVKGSEGGLYAWIKSIPKLSPHYVQLMRWALLAEKLRRVAAMRNTTMEELLERPFACSLKTLNEYLNYKLALPLERLRQQPFRYRRNPDRISTRGLHHFPGHRYNSVPKQVS